MVYIELSKVMNLDFWFKKTSHEEGDSKLSILIKNYNSAYVECGEINKKYIKEVATDIDTYLLCVIPTVDEIKHTIQNITTDTALVVQNRFIENIRTWAELSGIPLYKIHFADNYNYTSYCYSRDILIDTDKDRADKWSNLGGIGIFEEN